MHPLLISQLVPTSIEINSRLDTIDKNVLALAAKHTKLLEEVELSFRDVWAIHRLPSSGLLVNIVSNPCLSGKYLASHLRM